jgi:hypothetical protein
MSSTAMQARSEREAAERLAWTAYGLCQRFPGGPLGGDPDNALPAWVETLSATHGADDRVERAATARREAVDRATLRTYLASPEAREALKARPGFGLAGTAILPPTPRVKALRDGSVSFRVVAPYPEADTPRSAMCGPHIPTDPHASGYVPAPSDGAYARLVRAIKKLNGDQAIPVTPGEASYVIYRARILRHECTRHGYDHGVRVCDLAIRRARKAQYSARPVS